MKKHPYTNLRTWNSFIIAYFHISVKQRTMAYKDIIPVGTALILSATSFALGVIYGNLPYDYYTLWKHDRLAHLRSLNHYANWGNAPMRVHHILHFVIFLGLSGCFIKLYKPSEDAKYFEYGTLGLIMVGTVIYLTNLRIGANSCITGKWGEVDEVTGVNVMAASEFMIVVALIGALLLQGGLYYAQWYDERAKKEFFAAEAKKAEKALRDGSEPEVVSEKPAAGTTTSADVKKGKAKKRSA